MNYKKIGEFIFNLRKEKELTQKQLANKLYITDKAISKWERGLSIPDIEILEKLSKEFNVTIEEIISGEKGINKKINIEEEIEKIKKEINFQNKKTKIKLIISFLIIIIILLYFIFKFIYLGYEIKEIKYKNSYSNNNIKIGIPKTSFMPKINDQSYSFKNFRSSNTLKSEIKDYLKTLEYKTCNNTIYYYDEEENFSIIEYSVENNILYSTISYHLEEYDYCYINKLKEYGEKLGILGRIHEMNRELLYNNKNKNNSLIILFDDGYRRPNSDKYNFDIKLTISYLKDNQIKVLEESTGYYEIKNNKLYYYREEIKTSSKEIDIPEVSVFEIDKDKKLILIDNYLKDYSKEIVLK